MPDLLLELFSEEVPARMQRRATEDLRKLVTDALVERGFLYEGAKAYATPRRLAVGLARVRAKSEAKHLEVKLMPAAVGLDASGKPTPALEKKLAALGLAGHEHAGLSDKLGGPGGGHRVGVGQGRRRHVERRQLLDRRQRGLVRLQSASTSQIVRSSSTGPIGSQTAITSGV